MLPEVAVFDSTMVVALDAKRAEESFECEGLLPSLQSLRSFVAKTAREQRQRELNNRCTMMDPTKSVLKPGDELWGDPNNGRSFSRTANGGAIYEFRAGETLRSVVADLLTEGRKNDATCRVDYQEIRKAAAEIVAHNNICDADFIEAGFKLVIPATLVPGNKRAA